MHCRSQGWNRYEVAVGMMREVQLNGYVKTVAVLGDIVGEQVQGADDLKKFCVGWGFKICGSLMREGWEEE